MAPAANGRDDDLVTEAVSPTTPPPGGNTLNASAEPMDPGNEKTEAAPAQSNGLPAEGNVTSAQVNGSLAESDELQLRIAKEVARFMEKSKGSLAVAEGSESSDDEDDDYWASYIQKMERRIMRAANSEEKMKNMKAYTSTLVRGIIGYTSALEGHITKFEAAEMERAEREAASKGLDAAADTKTKEPESADKEADTVTKEEEASQEATPEEKKAEFTLGPKFFSAEGEFDSDGDWKNNMGVSGSYQCSSDPAYLIRVLCNWNEGITPKKFDEQPPPPNEIDIVAFGVLSEPIAAFFTKRLNMKVEQPYLLRMGKPFRPLICNLQPLQNQLTKLEERYGNPSFKPDGADVGDAVTKEQVSPSGLDAKDNNAAKETDDPLPFSGVDGAEEEEEKFDTKEALSHFRVLLEFVDKYFATQLQLFQRFKLGAAEKIAFADLWMLFDAGDTIYCPSQEGGVVVVEDGHTTKTRYVPQIFRVLGAVGGLPKRKTLAPKIRGFDRDEDDDNVFGPIRYPGFFMRERGFRRKMQADGARKPADSAETPASRRTRDWFTPLHVVCFHIDFDGFKYGAVREIFSFKPYDGLVDVRSLDAYPTQYIRHEPGQPGDENDATGDRYLARGRKFIDVTAVSHMSYEGLTVGKGREEINSAVIVDVKLAFQEYGSAFADGDTVVPKLTSLTGEWPAALDTEVGQLSTANCSILWCHTGSCANDAYADFHSSQVEKVAPKIKALLEAYDASKLHNAAALEKFKKYMEEKDLIRLLPGTVPGFALRNRKWVQLDLEQLRKLEQGDDWHKLVLPPGHREMVQAMVETHTQGSQEQKWAGSNSQGKVMMDLVQGKGRGCIILLHGVPGVGKTSTAECVASYTQRPLYPITCGDIGYVPEAVEKNMEEHFKLAHKWGCVLLLDEADVFLAKRTKGDVKRNGLVSVFLRILEYYSGILFLTTNRVGAIDDAFRSRLHLTLYYPKLTGKQTSKIWKNNLDRLKVINQVREENGQSPIEFDKKKILKWVDKNWDTLKWNGRQIRNAFQTAVALAEFQAKAEAEGGTRKSSKKAKEKEKSGSRTPREPVMKVDHFKLIADASMQFSEYLEETHGFDEDRMAHRDEIRAAAYEPQAKRKELQEVESSTSESDSDSGSEAESGSGSDSSGEESSKESEDSESEKEADKKTTRSRAEKDGGDKSKSSNGKAKSSKGSKKEKETEKPRAKDKKKRDK